MKVKKIFMSFLVLSFVMLGCNNANNDASKKDSKPVVTVTTSFLEDMVKQLAGDQVNVELVIPAGEDPHLYVAKASDLEKLKKADLILYHGLHFEGKMIDALEKKGIAVSKNFDEGKLEQMEEDDDVITDPHFWFDLNLYKNAVAVAAEELENLVDGKEAKAEIQEKKERYVKELDDLDKYIKEQLEVIPKEHRYLITPHDAFGYFARSYDFSVVAPQGVSTETEASNADISETVDFIVEHNIKAIFAESTTDPARMEKLKESVQAKGKDVIVVSGDDEELFSDSLAPQGKSGDTFIDMYKHNVDLIVKYLK